MSDPTHKPADHAVPSPEPRPHGDPLTGRGARPAGDEAARAAEAAEAAAAAAAADAAEASADGAGGADVPPVDAAAPGAPADAAPDPVAEAEAKAQQYLDLAQRKQAEFENFRRRMNREVAQAEDRGVSRLAKELLPALDHLELALQAAEQHAGGEEWVKGIRLVQDEVTGALGRVGIQAYAPVGEPFDPNEHEAMAQAPADGVESGNVAQVYQAGYRLNGAVLRPARVVVAQ